jgi:tetratricopeptide (TPR) repeat protein
MMRPPRIRRRWPLYAFIAGLAIVLGIVVAVATLPHGSKPKGLDPDSPAGQANEALERGDAARALQILDAAKATIGNDAPSQLVLGLAHAARNERVAALAAFKRALELAPELETDADLRANLRTMAADKSAQVVSAAFELWAGKTHDPEARKLLAKAASSDDMDRRHAAMPVVDRLNISEPVDRLAAYAYDLDQETTCEKRKEAVAKLRALGDPRAVSALERAVLRKGKTGPRGKSVNACLLDDATAAIGFLKRGGR